MPRTGGHSRPWRWVKILELGCSREVTTQSSLPLSLVFFPAIPDTHHECGENKQRWSNAWIGRHCSHTLQGLSIRNCCCARGAVGALSEGGVSRAAHSLWGSGVASCLA